MRARLAIRGRQNSPKVGLFESGSHRVVHIPHCGVHHPLINRVAGVVRRALVDARLSCYSDKAHLGIARYLQVVVERSSQTAQVVVVANCADADALTACFDLIRQRLDGELHSLWFNSNTQQGNTILGSQWQLICGPESVAESFGGARVHYPPGAFGQNNLDVAQQIIEQVRMEIPQGARVAEFHAGVGAIGLSLLDRAGALAMNEVSAASLHGLELGMRNLEGAQRDKIAVHAGAAGAAWPMQADAQVVIVDPPRKGLDADLRQHLRQAPPRKLIYISCGLDSFLQDCALLLADGVLRLTSLKAFNLMPFTEHVETLAVFERA